MAGERAQPALPGTDRVELGYWLSSEEHTPAALVGHAVEAEGAGFRHALISDHYAPWSPAQGESGFVWSVLGAIATGTRRLRVGTGVSAAVHRIHPVVLAQAAATVATLMPGRFFLGLGSGERLNEHMTGRNWPSGKERHRMLRDTIKVVRDLLDGDTVSRDGAHFRADRAMIHTRPDTPPPIVVAAGGDRTAKIAGELADGMIGVAPSAALVEAYAFSGGIGPRLAQLHVCWAESEAEARATAAHWWPNGLVPARVLGELALPGDIAAVASAVDDARITDTVVCGPDPERIVDAIHRFVAAGFTTVYLHQVGPDQHGFLELAKRELLPRFAPP